MNSRNTFANQSRKSQRTQETRERINMNLNYTARQNPPRHTNNPNVQDISKKIISILHKISNENSQMFISTILKPNSKTLNSTINSILYSFDFSFQSDKIENQVIFELFKFIGYPNNINKSVFQPVGAPHTWPACLQLLEWLAEVGQYQFEFRMAQRDYQYDEKLNEIILQSFEKQQNDVLVQKFFLKRAQNDLASISELQYQTATLELAIDNFQKEQPDIPVIDAKEKKKQQEIFREKQTIVSIDRKNDQIRNKLQLLESQYNQNERIIKKKQKINEELKKNIQSQEYNVQQVQNIQAQVKNSQLKKQNILINHQKNMEKYNAQKNQQLTHFMELQMISQSINQDVLKLQSLQSKSKLKNLKIPTLNYNLFMNNSSKNQESIQEKDKEIIWNKNQFINNQKLINVILSDFQNENTFLVESLKKLKKQIQAKSNLIQSKEKEKKDYLQNSNQAQKKMQSKQKQLSQLKQKINTLNIKNEQGKITVIEKLKQIEQKKRQIDEVSLNIDKLKLFLIDYELQTQKKLKQSKQIVQKFDSQCIKMLNQNKQSFELLSNQVVEFLKRKQQRSH